MQLTVGGGAETSNPGDVMLEHVEMAVPIELRVTWTWRGAGFSSGH